MITSCKHTVLAVGAILALGALATSANAGANLVTNGSFETTPNFPPDGNDGYNYKPSINVTPIPDWRSDDANGQATLLGPNNPFDIKASDGDWSMDLTGYDDKHPYGSVEQFITAKTGDRYQLSFDLGDSDFYNPSGVSVVASLESYVGTVSYDGSNTTDLRGNSWMTFTSPEVTATRNGLLLIIQGTAGGSYIGLDNIRVVDLGPAGAAPEPATWALMMIGFGGLGVALRTRQKAAPA